MGCHIAVMAWPGSVAEEHPIRDAGFGEEPDAVLVPFTEIDPAHVLAPGVAGKLPARHVDGVLRAADAGGVEVDPADILAPGEAGEVPLPVVVHAVVGVVVYIGNAVIGAVAEPDP